MQEQLLWIILLVTGVTLLMGIVFAVRSWAGNHTAGKEVREELRASRDESRTAGKELREEVSASLKSSAETISKTLEAVAKPQQAQLEEMANRLKDLSESNQSALDRIRATFDSRVKELQDSNEKKLEDMRRQVSQGLQSTSDALSKVLEGMSQAQQTQLDGMTKHLKELTESNQCALDRIRTIFDARVKELQDGNEKKLVDMRNEVSEGLKSTSGALSKVLEGMSQAQQTQLDGMTKGLKELTESNQSALDRIRVTFDARVKELQDSNEKKLEEMRKTVDDKLHETLEKRLGESFTLVSERLEAVQRGLGEMQSLATGVGDLKRVLTNVKVRGNWAEVQLGSILEQILIPTQYQRNVRVKNETSETVEYAIRLPGADGDHDACIWLPIDSKFPQEDYLRLQEAAERSDLEGVQRAADSLARTIRSAARDVRDKYVNPPGTTDFAIIFLATEGLYAEVLRQPSLIDELLQKYRVVVAGPTTLAAILSSLRMGFQTLAIEQRATEVWRVLAAVKTEFGKFGEVLDKVKRQLGSATRTIDETSRRTRMMKRKLQTVQDLPEEEAAKLLDLSAVTDDLEAFKAEDDF